MTVTLGRHHKALEVLLIAALRELTGLLSEDADVTWLLHADRSNVCQAGSSAAGLGTAPGSQGLAAGHLSTGDTLKRPSRRTQQEAEEQLITWEGKKEPGHEEVGPRNWEHA